MKWPNILAIIIVALVFLSIGYYAGQLNNHTIHAPQKIVVTDDLGRNVTIYLPIKRVVSMDPSNTQMMYAIGAGNLLVADTSYDWWPAQAKSLPKVEMDNGTASVEEVVSYNPNLVLATTIQSTQIIDQLESLGIPVLVLEPNNISGIYRDMYLLGNITGHKTGAINEVNYMKSYIGNITSKIANLPRLKVLYMLWPDPIYTAGNNTFINNIITTAGGINVAANLTGPWPIINNETVLQDNPQVILVDNDTGISNILYFKNNPVWENISAVQNNRVYIFNQTESSWMNEPGPLTIYAVRMVAQFLYPQVFNET